MNDLWLRIRGSLNPSQKVVQPPGRTERAWGDPGNWTEIWNETLDRPTTVTPFESGPIEADVKHVAGLGAVIAEIHGTTGGWIFHGMRSLSIRPRMFAAREDRWIEQMELLRSFGIIDIYLSPTERSHFESMLAIRMSMDNFAAMTGGNWLSVNYGQKLVIVLKAEMELKIAMTTTITVSGRRRG